MPVQQSTVTTISCDNPNCPNTAAAPNGLTFDNERGWLWITAEVYGTSAEKHIFCSANCAAAYTTSRGFSIDYAQWKVTGYVPANPSITQTAVARIENSQSTIQTGTASITL